MSIHPDKYTQNIFLRSGESEIFGTLFLQSFPITPVNTVWIYVMRSGKPYIKSVNVILRKCDLKWFGKKILISCFQWKYVESIASYILAQIWVSSDDHMSNYIGKNVRCIPTTHRNCTQSRQTGLPLFFIIASYRALYYLCW